MAGSRRCLRVVALGALASSALRMSQFDADELDEEALASLDELDQYGDEFELEDAQYGGGGGFGEGENELYGGDMDGYGYDEGGYGGGYGDDGAMSAEDLLRSLGLEVDSEMLEALFEGAGEDGQVDLGALLSRLGLFGEEEDDGLFFEDEIVEERDDSTVRMLADDAIDIPDYDVDEAEEL